ncbi:probable histone H2B 3 [Pyxicephalus adspersus]|uniref:probable histone H2B 3 n=1 Tax=Pyxicephalus adspersus TaxID=30357 RepID=UPI003B5B1292
MKPSHVSMKSEAMNKTMPQRTVGRKIRTKYSSYIYRMLKQDSQEQNINLSKGLDSIASEAARLCLYNKRRTITKKEIEAAMKNVLSRGQQNSVLTSESS